MPAAAPLRIDALLPNNTSSRIRESVVLTERHWVDLSNGPDLGTICQFPESSASADDLYAFHQLAKSWPSHPAAIFTYVCLFFASYVSFAGTARPVRIFSCLLVLALFVLALSFDVQLVKEHYHHWDDIIGATVLAAFVVMFVIVVYLNLFRDTHYYEKQKFYPQRRVYVHENVRPYSGGSAFGNYNLSKLNNNQSTPEDGVMVNGGDTAAAGGSVSNSAYNNDLAMRYFQIPRANYRASPRPLASMNQMR